MDYFPFYMDIRGQKGVIVGGGRVALEKITKLIPFAPELTVIAPDVLQQITELNDDTMQIQQRAFRDEDIEGAFFVIAATDDRQLNAYISRLAQACRIPVNVVDDPDLCTFLFPSIVKKGAFVMGISTGGASPQTAARLRRRFEAELPDEMEEFLDYLAQLRVWAKQNIADRAQRRELLKRAADFCLDQGRIPTEAELKTSQERIPTEAELKMSQERILKEPDKRMMHMSDL